MASRLMTALTVLAQGCCVMKPCEACWLFSSAPLKRKMIGYFMVSWLCARALHVNKKRRRCNDDAEKMSVGQSFRATPDEFYHGGHSDTCKRIELGK